MKLFFNYVENNQRLELDVKKSQTVKQIKQILEDYFKLDTSSTEKEEKRIVLEYGGSDLNDNWLLTDLTIPIGSTIRVKVKDEKTPDFSVYVKFQKESFKFYETNLHLDDSYVLELRIYLSRYFGFPLSIFRLKNENNVDLFDEKRLGQYKLTNNCIFILETWQGWDHFLQYTIKGYSKQVLKYLSTDEFIRQYQLKVSLYIAAHYGNLELINTLINMGARVDRPVGEHPCRQWCQLEIKEFNSIDRTNKIEYLRLEYLKCPVHAAVLNGQLKVVSYLAKTNIQLLEKKDGYNIPPWRLALHNTHKDPIKNANQKDVARFLLSKQFGGKVKLVDNFYVSIHLYAKIKSWVERAKEKVFSIYGMAKSSLKKRPFHKGGLVGNKVLIDGYNNNFKEAVNSYERLRNEYKFYYFIDQDDKDKHGYPDLYFKTVGLIKPIKPINFSNKKQEKKSISDKPIAKTLPLWKKAVNAIIFRITIKRYANILIDLGVEIDFDELNLGDNEPEENKDDFLKSVTNLEELKNSKKHELIKSGKVKNLLVQQTNVKEKKVASKSMSNLSVIPSKQIYNASVTYFEEQYNKIKRTKPKSRVFSLREDLKSETMQIYEKYRQGITPEQNALNILKDANTFKAKSWVQQIHLATQIAKGNVRRLIQKHSLNQSSQQHSSCSIIDSEFSKDNN